jgi:hypothetical protein
MAKSYGNSISGVSTATLDDRGQFLTEIQRLEKGNFMTGLAIIMMDSCI